jgi:hypothetical protein
MVRHTTVIHAEHNLDLGTGQDFLKGPACRFLVLV